MKHVLVVLALGGLVAGCDERVEKPPSAPKARSQAVVADPATAAAVTTPTAPPSVPASSSATPKRSQVLCAGQLEQPGMTLSDVVLAREVSGSQQPLSEELPVGKGRWTWLNFWAAWCVPCREEIPRLKRWESELAQGESGFELVFISLDDDERQLKAFLEKQPDAGLKRTYWIKDADTREEWFASVKMEPDPELPAHLLVDPKGKVRCVVLGAVEDSDLPAVKKIVSG